MNYLPKILEPAFFHYDFNSRLKKIDILKLAPSLGKLALPIISLHPYTRTPLMASIGTIRLFSSLSFYNDVRYKSDKKNISIALFEIAFSTASVAATIFGSPIAKMIAAGEDLIAHSKNLLECLNKKDYKAALIATAEITNDSLYLSLFFTGASQIVMASLSLQILLGLHSSYRDFQGGNKLQGAVNLLMTAIKGYQLKVEIGLYQLQNAINQHLEEVEKIAGLNEKEILEKAKEYFNDPEILKKQAPEIDRPALLGRFPTDRQVIDAFLDHHQGFCVGENHSHDTARAFLITNMDYLKSKNVKVLFAEGFHVSMQKTIDKYFFTRHLRNLESSEIKEIVKLFHYSMNNFKNKPDSPFTAFALLQKAKMSGIRLVAIDYPHQARPFVLDERIMKMNFIAAKVIEAHRSVMRANEKFVAWMGGSHLVHMEEKYGVKGVAELTETPAIWIVDNERNEVMHGKLYPELGATPLNFLLRTSASYLPS